MGQDMDSYLIGFRVLIIYHFSRIVRPAIRFITWNGPADEKEKQIKWVSGRCRKTIYRASVRSVSEKYWSCTFFEETEHRKADRTVGVNCFVFTNISLGTAWLLQGLLFLQVYGPSHRLAVFFSRRSCEHLAEMFSRHDGKRISTPPRNKKRKLPKSIRERCAKGTGQNRRPVQPCNKELYWTTDLASSNDLVEFIHLVGGNVSVTGPVVKTVYLNLSDGWTRNYVLVWPEQFSKK